VRLAGIDSEVLLDALVRHEAGRHLGLVRHQANRVASKYPGYEPEALFGMGWAGLIVALYKYDPTTSAFSTFAAIKIRGNIADSVRSESPIPKRLHTWYRKVSTAFEDLTSNLERRPTLEEVATELATTRLTRDLGRVPSLEEVASQLDAERQRMSILPRLSVPEALPADDAFGDRHFDEPESTAVLSGLQQDVWAALEALDPLEAAVIERVELRSRPIDEVACELGVTPRQVRTLRENGRARLAVALADWAPSAV
jgi:RNA polymerase sigma factor (sigma-70 family)